MLKQCAEAGPRSGKKTPITCHLSLITLLVAATCAGCAPRSHLLIDQSNYLTYDHPFTDAAAEDARKNAGKVCAERKRMAVKTRSVCSLKACTTHYQCVDEMKN